MRKSSSISAETFLDLMVPEQQPAHLLSSLHYTNDDPYAVRVNIHVNRAERVSWIFARSLIQAGMKQPSGEGDVTVWPSDVNLEELEDTDKGTLNIKLSSPDGEAHFQMRRIEAADFLARTHKLVPDGKESAHIDSDDQRLEQEMPAFDNEAMETVLASAEPRHREAYFAMHAADFNEAIDAWETEQQALQPPQFDN